MPDLGQIGVVDDEQIGLCRLPQHGVADLDIGGLLADLPGGIDRQGLEPLPAVNSLIRSDQGSRPRAANDGGSHRGSIGQTEKSE